MKPETIERFLTGFTIGALLWYVMISFAALDLLWVFDDGIDGKTGRLVMVIFGIAGGFFAVVSGKMR